MDILIGNAVAINSRFRSKDHCFVIGKLDGEFAYIVSCDASCGEVKPILREGLVKQVNLSELKERFSDFIHSKQSIGFGTPFVSIFELNAVIDVIESSIANKTFKVFGD